MTDIEHRSLAAADPYLAVTKAAQWTDFTIAKATREGYKVSGWIFKAVSLIARTAASVPWGLYSADGERIDEHPITKALENPNPEMSRQDVIELLVSWLQLSGVAYLYRLGRPDPGATLELWPISPDRLAPVASRDPGRLLDGYHVINEKGERENHISVDYTTENVIHFKLLDPSNPVNGISPLQAAAKAVDTDNAQADWNKAGMDNRGVFDGVFSFSETLTEEQAKNIMERIKERFFGRSRARRPLVLGSNAKYQRLSVTPAEMDFLESRKWNREEIMAIFGVPPQLVGSQEASTYNNFVESLRIFWEATVISLLDDLANTFNQSFAPVLPTGTQVGYDLSKIAALRKTSREKADTARQYWDMGVPLSVLNDHLALGLPEFSGWDLPFTGRTQGANPAEQKRGSAPSGISESRTAPALELRQGRDLEREHRARDKLAEGPVSEVFGALLSAQQAALFSALDSGAVDEASARSALAVDEDEWLKRMREQALVVALDAADQVAVGSEGRSVRAADGFAEALEAYLEQESWMLRDLSMIQDTTVALVVEQIRDALDQGKTVQELKQAIEDVGAFGPERSLRLARTLAGTAASLGQLKGAESAGATAKEWTTAGFEVRPIHEARDRERVSIDGYFSDQGHGRPRYPLDPLLGPADRVNCRCAMLFHHD